jgi:hypothetical protein
MIKSYEEFFAEKAREYMATYRIQQWWFEHTLSPEYEVGRKFINIKYDNCLEEEMTHNAQSKQLTRKERTAKFRKEIYKEYRLQKYDYTYEKINTVELTKIIENIDKPWYWKCPEPEIIIIKEKRHSWKPILKLYNTNLSNQLKISKMKGKRY